MNILGMVIGARKAQLDKVHANWQRSRNLDVAKARLLTGAELIAVERFRQNAEEGFNDAHDDHHKNGQLVRAAIAYSQYAEWMVTREARVLRIPVQWPWDIKWWKPSPEPLRNLVKAGALIAAEIDRLQRTGASK